MFYKNTGKATIVSLDNNAPLNTLVTDHDDVEEDAELMSDEKEADVERKCEQDISRQQCATKTSYFNLPNISRMWLLHARA